MEAIGELVAAAVVDRRVWDAQGNMAPDGVYLIGQPGPALPFVVFRAWKVPTGFVSRGDPVHRAFGPHDPPMGPAGARWPGRWTSRPRSTR